MKIKELATGKIYNAAYKAVDKIVDPYEMALIYNEDGDPKSLMNTSWKKEFEIVVEDQTGSHSGKVEICHADVVEWVMKNVRSIEFKA